MPVDELSPVGGWQGRHALAGVGPVFYLANVPTEPRDLLEVIGTPKPIYENFRRVSNETLTVPVPFKISLK